jgi:hypothetical protein
MPGRSAWIRKCRSTEESLPPRRAVACYVSYYLSPSIGAPLLSLLLLSDPQSGILGYHCAALARIWIDIVAATRIMAYSPGFPNI